MTETARRKRPRKATGPDRLVYFDAADTDRVMAVLLALVSEVASIRDRLDVHERIAGAGQSVTRSNVESYQPDSNAAADRETWRDAYIRRLFRVITEDVEALGGAGEGE
jgi:hypothetical protein